MRRPWRYRGAGRAARWHRWGAGAFSLWLLAACNLVLDPDEYAAGAADGGLDDGGTADGALGDGMAGGGGAGADGAGAGGAGAGGAGGSDAMVPMDATTPLDGGDGGGTDMGDAMVACPDRDSDQVCDDADVCDGGDDRTDTDDDGVPDDCDVCDGFDDAEDADSDGRPDGCDCDTDPCHAEANCTEDGDSLTCACRAGFGGDGVDTCLAVDCGPLTAPVNGSVDAPTTLYSDQATYGCDSGYVLGGGATRTCELGGGWSGTAPTCDPVDCGTLSAPTSGSVDISGGTTFGMTADYDCTTGYGLVGVSRRTCQANGNWSDAAPTCAIGDCSSLPSPQNGTATTPGGTTYGETATYACDPGYDLVGTATRTCQMDNTWSGTAPTCAPVDCGALGNPTNGSVDTASGTTYGEVASYSCNSGYDLSGSSTRTCQSDGNWSGSAPTCPPHDCGALSNPANGSVDTSDGTTLGDVATYGCSVGYTLSGSTTRTCGASGWSGSAPTCQIVDCGALSNPTNGSVDTTDGTSFGDVATYSCSNGYDLSGGGTRTCQANGSWSASAPTCVLHDCGALSSPTNGTVDTPDGTTFGEVATYACNGGYTLSGSTTRTCGSSGWSGSAPTCQIVDCGALSNPTNGTVNTSGGTTYGQDATYSCSAGYDLSDSTPRTCQANGSWSGSAPTCTLHDCGAPEAVTNGTVDTSGGTTYGQTATYTCTAGYYVSSGSATATCEQNGWSTGAPTCTLRDCGPLLPPSNGNVDTSGGTTYGQTATYTCDPFYAPAAGDTSRTCGADGNWTGTAPSCINACIDDLRISFVNNGTQDRIEITNYGLCTALLTGVFVRTEVGVDIDSITLPNGSIPPGGTVSVGEGTVNYGLSIPLTGSASASVMVCATDPCTSSTVLDALVWRYQQTAVPSLPAGVTIDAPLQYNNGGLQGLEHFYRINTRGARPTFRACDWVAARQYPIFASNFECNDYVEWSTSSGSLRTSTSTGNFSSRSLEQYGGLGVGTGPYYDLPASSQPTYISAWIKGSANGWTFFRACGYAGGDCANDITRTIFSVAFDGDSNRASAAYGGSNTSFTAMSPNTWFFVEIKDINWSLRFFDFYVDGVQVGNNLAFNGSGTSITRIDLYQSFNGSGFWDEVRVW